MLVLSLTGCDIANRLPGMPPEQESVVDQEAAGFDIEPDFSWELPHGTPHIAVDCTGYLLGQEKIGMLENCEAGETFFVVKQDNQESVWSGRLESSQSGMVYGDFTEVDSPGKYYLWNESVGSSYSFEIGEDVYRGLRQEAAEKAEIRGADEDSACYDVLSIIIAEETGLAGPDENENDLLYDKAAEQVREWIERTEGTPMMSAALAGMSVLCYGRDDELSVRCLSAARVIQSYYSRAFPEDAAGIFLMSTALYRAGGSLFDKNRAEAYLTSGTPVDYSDRFVYFGSAFYLLTRRKVNTAVCEGIMRSLTEETSAIAQNDRRSPYMVGENRKNTQEILSSAQRMAFVNYAITNHEYRTSLQNYMHYFLGRNSEKKPQIPEEYPVEWYLLLMACTQEEVAAITEN